MVDFACKMVHLQPNISCINVPILGRQAYTKIHMYTLSVFIIGKCSQKIKNSIPGHLGSNFSTRMVMRINE